MLQILTVKARLLRGASRRATGLVALLVMALGAFAAAKAARSRSASLVDRASGSAASEGAARGRAAAQPRSASASSASAAAVDAPDEACLAKLRALSSQQSELPRVNRPELRAQLFGRARATPVLFRSEPRDAEVSARAQSLRDELQATPDYLTLQRVLRLVHDKPELARAVFLRQGYLYVDTPELALVTSVLTLGVLFRDPEIRILRGAEMLRAQRLKDGDYEYSDGEDRGRRARIFLFDRVFSAGADPGPPLHVDLRDSAASLGFDELAEPQLVGEVLTAKAMYAGIAVPTAFSIEGARARLLCEAPLGDTNRVLGRRAQAARASQIHAKLLSVIKEQVEEGLPFDEPKTEEGQQDGKLRPEWRQAYLRGSSKFEFNGDRYSVFDGGGRPKPPQVCIDFILDTFERAGGSWWQSRGQLRERSAGSFRFDDGALENRRSVESFLAYARAHPEMFYVYEPTPLERVPFRQRSQFFSMLHASRDQFRRGDIVAILGPRDDGKLHYHSFFIVESDPLSGMPTAVAANAGRPRIRSWEGEMSNAPKRTIISRLRPQPPWLESFLLPRGALSVDGPQDGRPAEADKPDGAHEPSNPASGRPAAG